jgi:hypothetical protein
MSMIHQIGYKLLAQIRNFSGELSENMGKIPSRFVMEMIFGILSSGSVKLTEISRKLEERISLHKTHDRLCRNLNSPLLETEIEIQILHKASNHIRSDSLIIIDPSDIVKPYAKKMEYLTQVRDGSTKEIKSGYWLCSAIAFNPSTNKILPLINRLYSSIAPEFISENDHILDISEKILSAANYRGTIVFDRGGDRRTLLIPWTEDDRIQYIVRQRGDRKLLFRRGRHTCSSLAEYCDTPYSEQIIKIKDGKSTVYDLKFGYLPVRFPECPNRQLFLVVVNGFGKEPMMLLTTLPVRKNRKVIWNIIENYLARWKIEETIRYIKQSYQLEDVRIMTYQRLKNLMNLVLAASYFTCAYLGIKERLKILVGHALKAAKRLFGIPDFHYYSISDGIKAIFDKHGKGIQFKKPPNDDGFQKLLFSP